SGSRLDAVGPDTNVVVRMPSGERKEVPAKVVVAKAEGVMNVRRVKLPSGQTVGVSKVHALAVKGETFDALVPKRNGVSQIKCPACGGSGCAYGETGEEETVCDTCAPVSLPSGWRSVIPAHVRGTDAIAAEKEFGKWYHIVVSDPEHKTSVVELGDGSVCSETLRKPVSDDPKCPWRFV
ncbi:MAG: hypothetical protein VX446_07030, partial [Bacteroidota bacterium]|nr:hypothetical protein [Bacteroidota bacterium]